MPSTTAQNEPVATGPKDPQPPSSGANSGARPPRSGPSSRHPPHRRPASQQHLKSGAASSRSGVNAHGNGKDGKPGEKAARQPLRSMASLEVVARTETTSPNSAPASKTTAVTKASPATDGNATISIKGVAKKRSHGKNLGNKSSRADLASANKAGTESKDRGRSTSAGRRTGAGSGTSTKAFTASAPVVQATEPASAFPANTKPSTLNPSAPEFSFAPSTAPPPSFSASLPARAAPSNTKSAGHRVVSDPIRNPATPSFASGSNRHPLPSRPHHLPASLPSKPSFLPDRPAELAPPEPDSRFASLTAPVPMGALTAALPTTVPLPLSMTDLATMTGTYLPLANTTFLPGTRQVPEEPDSPLSQLLACSLPPTSSSVPSFAPSIAPLHFRSQTSPTALPTTIVPVGGLMAAEDLTPKTQRRVAGQGLKKAMSEAALRRGRSSTATSTSSASSGPVAALGLGRRPSTQQSREPFRSVSDSSSSTASSMSSSKTKSFGGAHRRSSSNESSLRKLPLLGPSASGGRRLEDVEEDGELAEEDAGESMVVEVGDEEEDKENHPPSMVPGSPETPSPRPSIVSLPDIVPAPPALDAKTLFGVGDDEQDGDIMVFTGTDEDDSPPSPAAMLLSASFSSWPAESMRPSASKGENDGKKVRMALQESVVIVEEPEETADTAAAETEEGSKRRSYVPKPLLLPSKLARSNTTSSSSSSASNNGARSPKSSTSSQTAGRSHVRAATLAGVSLSFSALAERTEQSARTGFQGRRESFVGMTGSPTRRRFGPVAGAPAREGSVHSRRSSTSVISLSPPASPTLASSPRIDLLERRRRSAIEGGSGTPGTPRGAATGERTPHSRSISVTSGRKRERPASVVGAGAIAGLGFMKSIEEAMAAEQEKEGLGNGVATVSSGSEAVDAATAQSSALLPAVELGEPTHAVAEVPLLPAQVLAGTAKVARHGQLGKKERLRPPPVSVPVEEGYCSLQELLEQAGVLHTRVISPDRKAITATIAAQAAGSPSPSPPQSPKLVAKAYPAAAQAVRAKTSLVGIFSAVKDVLLPPASRPAPHPTADVSLSSLPASPPHHGRSNSGSTMSSFGAEINGKSPELEAAEQAVRGRIAGWVQHTEECLLDDLRPTVLLPGQKMVGNPDTPARAAPVPSLAFSPDKYETDARPFKVGSPPPPSGSAMVPTRLARRNVTLPAPKLVKRATSDLLLRKPSMPVLSAGVLAAPSLTAVNAWPAASPRLNSGDDFVLIHDVDGPAVSTFENVSATEVQDLFDPPSILSPRLLQSVVAAATRSSSQTTASPAVQSLRRQGSAEGLARAKLGKLLEMDEERLVKRKKSLGALAYGPPPRIIVTASDCL